MFIHSYKLLPIKYFHQNGVDSEKGILYRIGTVLMDLSKAYDCLPHDLLTAKLAAYVFDNMALALITDSLKNRLQQVKIRTFSSYLEILRGVPQGSILGLILFNFFVNDPMFFIKET